MPSFLQLRELRRRLPLKHIVLSQFTRRFICAAMCSRRSGEKCCTLSPPRIHRLAQAFARRYRLHCWGLSNKEFFLASFQLWTGTPAVYEDGAIYGLWWPRVFSTMAPRFRPTARRCRLCTSRALLARFRTPSN